MNTAILKFETSEHKPLPLKKVSFPAWDKVRNKRFGISGNKYCFNSTHQEDEICITVGYYIGVDWLVEGEASILVAPKLNTRPHDLEAKIVDGSIEIDDDKQNELNSPKEVEIDYFSMLRDCLHNDYLYQEIDNLVHIDWKAQEISIMHTQDWLSPLLIVKYLTVLKSIVRKGLKKSYYQVTRNLSGKIKGKVLVGSNIKHNLVKNKPTHTICQFEEFGIDSTENQLLKKAFRFACSYLENHASLFGEKAMSYFTSLMQYCRPAFEFVSDDLPITDIKGYKPNPFFKEYTAGIQLARLLLKRYAYTISNTTNECVSTPPYWIDMPRLFELYAYQFLKNRFAGPNEVFYHLRTHGNELDFLVNTPEVKLVVDAKYKPLYAYGKNHDDIRQVAGYARLNKVYDSLGLTSNDQKVIECVILYPDIEKGLSINELQSANLPGCEISGYCKMYKIGIKLPTK